MSYQLSQIKKSHTRDLRCLDYYNGYLTTGSSDHSVKYYQIKQQKIQQKANIDFFEKNILSLQMNKFNNNGEIFVIVGCADGKIYGLDPSGTPFFMIQHNSPISSICFINQQHFVTGSWDGKAIVWNIKSQSKISQYPNHKHAVAVLHINSTQQVVSGSQDKALAIWNWKTGKQLKRKQGVHGDIIRQISPIPGVGFATCSNDQTIKIWTTQLQQISHLLGHSSFVFTIKVKQLGTYYSAGDDKSIKIWKNQKIVQTLQCPSSIWSIALDQSDNVYAGCTDGYLRIFTTIPERKAPQNVIDAYNKQILDSAAKKSGMSSQQIKKLPTIADMMKMSGKKQGEIRVFKNGLIPEAFMWQKGKWEKIGQVITENTQQGGGMSQSRYYPGDKYFEAGEYDHIFDVDDDSGIKRQIPFNDGGNALQAAQKFCLRQGRNKGYIEQIRKFLMQNSSKIPRSSLKPALKQVSQNALQSTPFCIAIQFSDIKNPQALIKKIYQFNSLITGPQKLIDRELQHCKRIATLLENSKTYHTFKLDFKQMDTLKKLLTWPIQYKLPVWDMYRAFLCHYQSESLFSGLNAGFDIISQLIASLQSQNSQPFYALIFRTFTNVMIQNTNKNGIVRYADTIFSSVQNFSKKAQLRNKTLLKAISGFMFNFSVTVYQKNLQNQQIISTYAKILQKRFQIDDDQENRNTLLQAAANIMFKYQTKRQEFIFLNQYLNANQVSHDVKLLIS